MAFKRLYENNLLNLILNSMRPIDYAQKNIQITAQENGIQNVIIEKERLFIEFPSGKCYELADAEIKYQAEEFLNSELENIRNS